MVPPLAGRRAQSLRRCEQEYAALKQQLLTLGYILQGSVTERWNQCGRPWCHCHKDPHSRHGPYHQWSWKDRAKTQSVYLDADQAQQCREWIHKHRQLERLLKRMRAVSLRAARRLDIPRK
jgi:hypothetical protein